MIPQKAVVVFGLYETGLGIIRSLGRKGIKVIGVDFKKDIGWYSRYVKPYKCPHPLQNELEFTEWIISEFSGFQQKAAVFFSSDDFLISFSRNRNIFRRFFLFNLVDHSLIEKIADKYKQFLLASNAGIDLPSTFCIDSLSGLSKIPGNLNYPLFIKGKDVNLWRKVIGGNVKGFLVKEQRELEDQSINILNKGVPVVIQEVVLGPDTNHYKYCCYISESGEILAEFTLQKIRQNPIHFGVGAVVVSSYNDEVITIGRKLFRNIGFTGIGSAEFKLDNRNGELKLIEINPRYWQQNYLSTRCGMNFPYLNYLDVLGVTQEPVLDFINGIKWINRQLDFDSFLKYRKEHILTFKIWRKSVKGVKIYSDFTWDDPIPAFYNIGFGWKIIKAPGYLLKRTF